MPLISRIRRLIPSYALFPLIFALLWNQAVYCGDFLAKGVCLIFFLLLPTTNIRPEIAGRGIWETIFPCRQLMPHKTAG